MARYLVEEVYELVDAIISKMRPPFAKKPAMYFSASFCHQPFLGVGKFCLKDVVEKNLKR
jgi:hypothetical protein